MSTASHRTAVRVWWRVMPTARSRPSSRVRSWIDSAMLLAMLNRAMTTASAEQPVHEVDDLVELRGLVVDVLVAALQLGVGVGVADRARWPPRRRRRSRRPP